MHSTQLPYSYTFMMSYPCLWLYRYFNYKYVSFVLYFSNVFNSGCILNSKKVYKRNCIWTPQWNSNLLQSANPLGHTSMDSQSRLESWMPWLQVCDKLLTSWNSLSSICLGLCYCTFLYTKADVQIVYVYNFQPLYFFSLLLTPALHTSEMYSVSNLCTQITNRIELKKKKGNANKCHYDNI